MNLRVKEIRERINTLITVKAHDTILNHLRSIVKFYFSANIENIYGKVGSDSFLLWQFNDWWGGIFYPVIFGKIERRENQTIVVFKSKLNIIGKTVNAIIIISLGIASLIDAYDPLAKPFRIDLLSLCIYIILMIGLQSVPFFAYWITKRNSMDYLKELLNK